MWKYLVSSYIRHPLKNILKNSKPQGQRCEMRHFKQVDRPRAGGPGSTRGSRQMRCS